MDLREDHRALPEKPLQVMAPSGEWMKRSEWERRNG